MVLHSSAACFLWRQTIKQAGNAAACMQQQHATPVCPSPKAGTSGGREGNSLGRPSPEEEGCVARLVSLDGQPLCLEQRHALEARGGHPRVAVQLQQQRQRYSRERAGAWVGGGGWLGTATRTAVAASALPVSRYSHPSLPSQLHLLRVGNKHPCCSPPTSPHT